MKIYKYVKPELLEKHLDGENRVNLKLEFPKNYNDPLELFLTVSGPEMSSRFSAYYQEVLGILPQLPTTCFSKRPDIIPMWAHYGMEHTGFVIEIDEAALCQSIPIAFLEDVEYADGAGTISHETVAIAATTLKPRHTLFLEQNAFRAAYLTKNRCWEYEQERRLVTDKRSVREVGGVMLLTIPGSCVTGIISGSRSSEVNKNKIKEISARFGCKNFNMKIGKLAPKSYFTDDNGNTFIFTGTAIERVQSICPRCKEPHPNGSKKICQWCKIRKGDRDWAYLNNPNTILGDLGLLKSNRFGMAGKMPVGTLPKGSV